MIKAMFSGFFSVNCRKNVHVGRFYETSVKFHGAGDATNAVNALIGVFDVKPQGSKGTKPRSSGLL